MLKEIYDKLTDLSALSIILIFVGIGIFIFGCLGIIIKDWSTNQKRYNKTVKLVMNSTGATEEEIKKKINGNDKNFIKKLKKNSFVRLYKEFVFFGGKGAGLRFFLILSIGYLLTFVALFFVCDSIPLALILALCYVAVFYIIVDGRNEKLRKKYIKGFSMALKTITASTDAGNSFKTAIELVISRESTNKKIHEEFAILNNHLNTNKTIEEALEIFWKRNSMFQEFSLFVITIQFFFQKGGDGLSKVMADIETTLDQKIENYSIIDSELGINKTLMNVLIVIYPIALFAIRIFMPTIYIDLVTTGIGYVKALGSILLYFMGVIFYKKIVRNAAEG